MPFVSVSPEDRDELFFYTRTALAPLFQAFGVVRPTATPFNRLRKLGWNRGSGARIFLASNFFVDQNYVIAGTIVLLGDSFTKGYMTMASLSPVGDRSKFGPLINGVKLGDALQACGNAFRHYEEWNAGQSVSTGTDNVLNNLGISQRDASVCYRFLQLCNVSDREAFESKLNDYCDVVETKQGIP